MKKLAAATFLAFLVGCGGGVTKVGKPVYQPERGTVAHAEVSDDQFARAVKDLLATDPGGTERQSRLERVCEKQMSRAHARFPESPERGLAAVFGAISLVHHGELDRKMIGENGVLALDSAAREYSHRGDEARARAIYEMLARLAPQESGDVKSHLAAINDWMRDTGPAQGAGPVAKASAASAFAVRRALLEPSKEALDDAAAKTIDWVSGSIAIREAYRAHKSAPPDRDELREAVRGLAIGGTTLAALYLRDGDAANGLGAVERAKATDLLPKEFGAALEHAAKEPTPAHFLDLSRAVRNVVREQDEDGEPEALPDLDLLRAATLGTSFEAYRLDSTEPEAALGVAVNLLELGMAEAAPAVLADSVRAHDDPRVWSAALTVTIRAMNEEVDADDLDAARRAFNAAAPILAGADRPELAGKLQPSPARVRALMGEVELREGNVKPAHELLSQAVAQEKSGFVLLQLARIDRFEDRTSDATQKLKDALSAEDAQKDSALRGEIWLLMSDLARDKGDAANARSLLSTALSDLAKARSSADAEERARVERVIARVLDRFGASRPAEKALERALDAAPRDKRQAAATVGQLVARAFVHQDLRGARDALNRGLALDLPGDELVYEALWVRLLERQQNSVQPDPSAEHVLANAKTDPRWVGKIASFGLGLVSASDLKASAKNPAQQTEALFYAAMSQRASGDRTGSDATLREVLTASGLELVEVALARDLLAGPRAAVAGPVPEVGLP